MNDQEKKYNELKYKVEYYTKKRDESDTEIDKGKLYDLNEELRWNAQKKLDKFTRELP